MRCSNCGSENPADRKFCGQCGAQFLVRCLKCGKENVPPFRFCGECGAALADAVVARVDEAKPITAPAGERRHLTVLFCDLVGSTQIAAQLDPEEWREIVDSYHRAATEAITRFGGYVAQYLGDGVMAYFGWPEAHDNNAERATRAGLAIVDAIAKLNQHSARPELSARIGIDSGAVVVGASAGREADVFGDTPNIAARVQTAADPGTVLVTADTHRLASGLFVVEDCGAHALKGVERPVQLYRVIQASGVRGRLEAVAAARGLTPFVGREDELRLLMNRWERALEGEGQVALIIGEAGIGKSRLVQCFREQIVTMAPHIWMEAAAAPFFQNTPYYPVSDLLRQLVALPQDQIAEEQLTRLASALLLARLKPAEAIPLIAPLLNLPIEAKYPPSALPPEEQRRRLLATLVEWVLSAARTQPLVIATEDLHWADPSTLELIQLLVEQGATARLLLLYTARPEFRPQWPLRAHHTQITLNRLSARNVREMIAQMAARDALASETVDTVIERTGGVPLFVEELTRAVLESGARLAGREIPVTLHDSLMARLDRLGPAKEVIQIGAVIGSEFSYELLHAVHPIAEQELLAALLSATDAELVYVRGIPPDATYRFKHALIRDAAYEALLKSRRRELHRLAARTIVDKFSALKEAHPEVLARHWTEAGETEQAILYWQQAGQRATQRLANVEAIAHLTKGLELLKAQPDTPERAQQELLLQLALGAPLIVTKSWAAPEVGAVYTRTQELCRQIGGTPLLFQALEGLWLFHFNRGEFQSACGLAEQLLDLAQRQHDPAFLMGAHSALGTTLFRLGELVPAQEHLENSIALADPQPSSPYAFSFAYDPRIGSLSYSVWNLWMLGYMDRALKRGDETLTLARELSHPFRLAYALIYNVRVHQLRREVQTTREQVEALIGLGTEHGFTTMAEAGRIWKSWALVEQGQEEGIGQMQQGIAALRATGTSTLSSFLGLLAESCGKRGRTEEGLAAVTEALALVNETGERFWEAELHRLKGELTLAQSGIQRLESSIQNEAEECFQKAITIARRQRAKSLELRAVMSLARLWQQGKKEEARRLLTEIYSWFTEGFDTKDLQEAKALLEELS